MSSAISAIASISEQVTKFYHSIMEKLSTLEQSIKDKEAQESMEAAQEQPEGQGYENNNLKVCSFDYDGCAGPLFDHAGRHAQIVSEYEKNHKYVERHQEYIAGWKQHITQHHGTGNGKTIVISGSARQDHETNDWNILSKIRKEMQWKGTEYEGMIPTEDEVDSFKQFPKVVDLMDKMGCDVEFCRLLLPDEGLEPGYTMEHTEWTIRDGKRPLDSMKVNLLNFQAEWFSKQYPDKNIELSFFDDRDDILQTLKEEVVGNMPGNVTLKLYKMCWFDYVHGKMDQVIQEY